MKELKHIRNLNSYYEISIFDLLNCKDQVVLKNYKQGKTPSEILMNRLSYLGARYPQIAGLSLQLSGLRCLEGKRQGKKIFDFLVYFTYNCNEADWFKMTILNKIGTMLLNNQNEGHYWENSLKVFSLIAEQSLAKDIIDVILNFNRSSLQDSLRQGANLAKGLKIQFFLNTAGYKEKVRRRGYARSTPVRPGSSKSEIRASNSSWESLVYQDLAEINEEGEIVMKNIDSQDIEEVIFNIFKRSHQLYDAYQAEILERRQQRDETDLEKPDSEVKEENSE